MDLVSIDTSLGNLGGCPIVTDMKPNLSTYRTAYLINDITGYNIYNLNAIKEIESTVKHIMHLLNITEKID